MRLFLGIELDDTLRDGIARLQGRLQGRLPDRQQSLLRSPRTDVRWVNPEGAHLTLHFLGELDAPAAARVDAAIAPLAAAASPLTLRLEGVGAFPDERRPRVIWVGCSGETGALARLRDDTGAALRHLGLAIESRPFNAHVTVGRVRSVRHGSTLTERIARHRDLVVGPLAVRELVLFRSHPGQAGPRYEARTRYLLGAPSPGA